jgi:sodium/hydrogen exchanger 10/11
MRILKAKKMSYSRQYENGMMSQEAIRILSQAVELAMDTDEAVIELDGLQKRFTKEVCSVTFSKSLQHSLLSRVTLID